jgi:spoIIIJ-associated protein
MGQEKTTLETIAPSVEEAVNRGLEQLGLPKEAVNIEILDNGSRGLLGIGGRQARVRLSLKAISDDAAEEIKPVEKTPRKRAVKEPVTTEPSTSESLTKEPSIKEPPASKPVDESTLSEDERKAMKLTKEVVEELLERMHVRAMISANYIEPVDENDERMILIDIEGNDLSILIGRRSETLNALQYISSLIVSKELNRWVPMMIDVQGYRSRRERQLRQLGRRMAEQAIQTGKRQVLEPMSANERRVIHLELRDHAEVTTESTGDEPYRKVTIVPKR